MQHVSSRAAMAGAEPVHPKSDLGRLGWAHRLLVHARHAWVLHRLRITRLAAAGLTCLALGGVFTAREHLLGAVEQVAGLVQAEFGNVGFAIRSIEISGQTLSQEREIVSLLDISPSTSMLSFDPEAARLRLQWLRAVQGATIRKVYPGRLEVTLVERVPVARWRSGGMTYLVDAHGRTIGEDFGDYAQLPLVLGEGASDDALVMIMALERFEALKAGLVALSRIGDRRWDMIYESGLRVQLPEQGVSQALAQLQRYQADHALLDRDVTVVDLRVSGAVALTPSAAAREQLEALRSGKKPTVRPDADSDYATPDEQSGLGD